MEGTRSQIFKEKIDKYGRMFAGDAICGFFAGLVVGFVLASLSAAGVITMTLAWILLALAWVVAICGSFLLPRELGITWRGRSIFGSVMAAILIGVGVIEYALYVPPLTEAGIAREIRGGDAYAYFIIDLKAPRDPDRGLRFWIKNSSDHEIPRVAWWVYPPNSGSNPYGDEYRSLRALSGAAKPLPIGGFLFFKKSIKPGKYAIDFVGGNQPWYQQLSIEEEPSGKTIIKTKVTRNGKILCELPARGDTRPCS